MEQENLHPVEQRLYQSIMVLVVCFGFLVNDLPRDCTLRNRQVLVVEE